MSPLKLELLDLRDVPCPQNVSQTLIKIASLDSGEMIEIILKEGEAHENVKESLLLEGINILEDNPEGEILRRLIIKA
jgi:TusA-related sulfurtransferase